MRVLVFSKDSADDIERLLAAHGFGLVKGQPDVVVSVGGDGTLLLAEHEYPGIPKLAIGKSKTCKKCVHEEPKETIETFAANKGRLPVQEYLKIEADLDGRKLPLALNDVVLRNKDQMHAIRFSASHDGQKIADAIGDGVVVSTVFGSTAYYQSLTRETFEDGMGLAFNNTLEPIAPAVEQHGAFVIELSRGTGILSVDTLEQTWEMEPGNILTVRISDETAQIIEF